MQFDWSAIWPAIPLLIEGAKMTLWISVLGLAGGDGKVQPSQLAE